MTPNWLTQYNFDRQANEAAQAAVNQAAQAGSTEEMLRAHVIAVADSFHLPYPQYANFWDGPEWGLMQAKRQIKTKGGVAFEPGDWTVVKLLLLPDEQQTLAAEFLRQSAADCAANVPLADALTDIADSLGR